MSDDWRPYDPSLEAERRAVYERASRSTLAALEIMGRKIRNPRWFERVFGPVSGGGET